MSGHFLDELRASFADHAQRPAPIFQGHTYSYGELDERARRCAALAARARASSRATGWRS